MRNIRLIIEYDGTGYFGWQRQRPDFPTIQQVIEEKINRMTGESVHLHSSGRTDAGVHALKQVANFLTETKIPERNLLLGLNSLLPSDIAIKDLKEVDGQFHARYSAKSKVYLYRILNSPVRSPLSRNFAWHVREPLDLSAMKEASCMLKGSHDFSSFCGADNESRSFVRMIFRAELEKEDRCFINFIVEADGFLRYMVRNIVGTLHQVGAGKITPEEFASILNARDRRRAGPTAPAQGLFLKEVKY
ncbi:MAG: tRNA pseudouridine(38-40) synthase TruA [Syntrophales bacterium]|nr:tRNA pseudouridine(38-40) synthase TruA [Syntrophales bacterium]MDD5234002.1 tRNA pseudouridine(38-40) synthase TruA [Syntrophales bacterium]HPL64461.1 tRNA pseudouridine(38-40) synthase TruA [Syntrophales bacterium]